MWPLDMAVESITGCLAVCRHVRYGTRTSPVDPAVLPAVRELASLALTVRDRVHQIEFERDREADGAIIGRHIAAQSQGLIS